ncbi:MAG: 50S ribosomal protein L25 [Candidatus Marinimicrobia bacterium]|nr:50S ribosomal protein L25 [Candidatus Neomarinimicrobiota bacterium]MDD5583000.1 50S ribosomal protein L25 [Candidatus Neomarinimicrobiota bacterium]
MTEAVKLNVTRREERGKEKMKKLRSTGNIPAIFYMHTEKPIPLSVNLRELHKVLKTGERLIDIYMDDLKRPKKAIFKEIQYHPVTDEILHIDFQGVDLQEEVEIEVRINFKGAPIGLKEGGLLDTHLYELLVKCKAGEIPHELYVDISNLHINESLRVGDLVFEGVEVVTPADSLIVSIAPPTKVSLEEEKAELEGEGLEGEEQEGKEEESKEE